MRSHAEALQDVFAHWISLHTHNCTYIEIGAAYAQQSNTTYVLDTQFDWQGFSLELNTQYQAEWQNAGIRRNPCYFENALTFDYRNTCAQLNMDHHVGYLSCDIDPPNQTFAALQTVISQGLSFDCITFEHDLYYFQPDHDQLSQAYLAQHGYKVAVRGVYPLSMPGCVFETWYVKSHLPIPELTFEQFIQLAHSL